MMKAALSVLVLFMFLVMSPAEGYKYFQDKLPNGARIPHPCKPNHLWYGLGHRNVDGGGDRNVFGKDFAKNGFKWDSCLCRHDSDRDGKSNGEELGDPECKWAPGQIPSQTTRLSHPGICEPLDDPKCEDINDWGPCKEYVDLTCDPIYDPEVRNITLRFPKTKVPAVETTYICMTFDLPADIRQGEYHMIADEPLIDNAYVMHHMTVYGCLARDGNPITKIPAPKVCGMASQECQQLITGWTVGAYGSCFGQKYGIRIGKTAYQTILIEKHWNNPELREDYEDSSGITIFYTPILRLNDAGSLMTGPEDLELLPGLSRIEWNGTCSSRCTKNLPHKIYIVEANLHMHYLGISGAAELRRNGKKVADIIRDDKYNYDQPYFKTLDPPIEVLPGDEISTYCNFKTSQSKDVVYYGEGTADEMCYGFFVYYPVIPDFAYCTNMYNVDFCETIDDQVVQVGQCVVGEFLQGVPKVAADLDEACIDWECTDLCQAKIDEILAGPCYQLGLDDRSHVESLAQKQLEAENGWTFLYKLHICDETKMGQDNPIDNKTIDKNTEEDRDDHDHEGGHDQQPNQGCPFAPQKQNTSEATRAALSVLSGFIVPFLILIKRFY